MESFLFLYFLTNSYIDTDITMYVLRTCYDSPQSGRNFELIFLSFLGVCICSGGKKFWTTVDTLTRREPDSMLAAMSSGRPTVCQESEKVV